MLVQDKNYNFINRTVLLLMVELANNNYEITNSQVKHFYQSNIKTISFEHPFSQEETKVVAETKTENGTYMYIYNDNLYIKILIKENMLYVIITHFRYHG